MRSEKIFQSLRVVHKSVFSTSLGRAFQELIEEGIVILVKKICSLTRSCQVSI